MFNPFKSFNRSIIVFFAATFFTLSASAASSDNPPELSEKTQEGTAPLQKLLEAQNWDAAITTIDGLITKVGAKSFDRAFLLGLKAQIYGTSNRAIAAIPLLEEMVQIGDALNLFRFTRVLPMSEADAMLYLTQLYMQDATQPGKTIDYQRASYAKAHLYAKRLISLKKTTDYQKMADAQTMWARLLYYEAAVDPSKIDMTLMKQAAAEAYKALLILVKPKEDNYTLYLACLQQMGDNTRAAEILELMVNQFPKNKNNWLYLFQVYSTMAASGDKTAELSAIVTMERAQAVGQLTSNKDNFMLAGLYFNIQQYQFAAELLEKGLRSGAIDPEQKNWELWAACYQQMGNETRAIEVFLEAIKLFPKASNLELQLGQIYYGNDKHSEAFQHLKAAVDKGLEKPGQTLLLLSYLSLEAKNLDEALVYAHKAAKADPKSKEIRNMVSLVNDSINEREKFKNQK